MHPSEKFAMSSFLGGRARAMEEGEERIHETLGFRVF
jgi:hypothetical protein